MCFLVVVETICNAFSTVLVVDVRQVDVTCDSSDNSDLTEQIALLRKSLQSKFYQVSSVRCETNLPFELSDIKLLTPSDFSSAS